MLNFTRFFFITALLLILTVTIGSTQNRKNKQKAATQAARAAPQARAARPAPQARAARPAHPIPSTPPASPAASPTPPPPPPPPPPNGGTVVTNGCKLPDQMKDSSSPVVFSIINNKYQVINTENVRSGAIVYAFCPRNKRRITNGQPEHTCAGNNWTSELNWQCKPHKNTQNVQTIHQNVKGKCSLAGYKDYDIGFYVFDESRKKQIFVPVYTICYKGGETVPIYSTHILTQYIREGTIKKRPYLPHDKIYKNVDGSVYQHENQKLILENDEEKKQINENTYWNHGHLTPKGDFNNRFQVAATYHLNNMVPQWKPYNEGIWSLLENKIRLFAKANGDATVYTGTFGIGHTFENQEELFIPKWIWKTILVNEETINKYVFISYNLPGTPPDTELCPEDIASKQHNFLQILDPTNNHVTPNSQGAIHICDKNYIKDEHFKKLLGSLTAYA